MTIEQKLQKHPKYRIKDWIKLFKKLLNNYETLGHRGDSCVLCDYAKPGCEKCPWPTLSTIYCRDYACRDYAEKYSMSTVFAYGMGGLATNPGRS